MIFILTGTNYSDNQIKKSGDKRGVGVTYGNQEECVYRDLVRKPEEKIQLG